MRRWLECQQCIFSSTWWAFFFPPPKKEQEKSTSELRWRERANSGADAHLTEEHSSEIFAQCEKFPSFSSSVEFQLSGDAVHAESCCITEIFTRSWKRWWLSMEKCMFVSERVRVVECVRQLRISVVVRVSLGGGKLEILLVAARLVQERKFRAEFFSLLQRKSRRFFGSFSLPANRVIRRHRRKNSPTRVPSDEFPKW